MNTHPVPPRSLPNPAASQLFCHRQGCSHLEPIQIRPGSTPQCPACHSTADLRLTPRATASPTTVRSHSLIPWLIPATLLLAFLGYFTLVPKPSQESGHVWTNRPPEITQTPVVDPLVLASVQDLDRSARDLFIASINLPIRKALHQPAQLDAELRRQSEALHAYTNLLAKLASDDREAVQLALSLHQASLSNQPQRNDTFRLSRLHLDDTRLTQLTHTRILNDFAALKENNP